MNHKTSKPQSNEIGIAVCAFSVRRPARCNFPRWRVPRERWTAVRCARMAYRCRCGRIDHRDFAERKNRTVIDYEHQTLLASQTASPHLQAAGLAIWWRESGLYATDTEWTERASNMIQAANTVTSHLFSVTTKPPAQSKTAARRADK